MNPLFNPHARALGALALAVGLAGSAAAAEPQPAASPTPAPPTLAWKDGRTTAELGSAQINLTTRIQIRFTEGLPQDGEHIGSFRLRRARTSVDGWVYTRALEFELMVDWVDEPIMEDLFLNWDISRHRALQLKMGQFKVPFGRQELTSDTGQQFVDRSIVSAEFARGRDQGLQVWGLVAARRIEYRVGVFNGNGRGRTTNDNGRFQYDARLVFQPWGDARYSEGDFESKGRPLLALGLGLEHNDARTTAAPAAGAPATFQRTVAAADLSVKYRGVSLMAEGFRRRLTPTAGPSFRSNGYHVQAGAFLLPGKLEGAARLATWDPSSLSPGDAREEKGLALNYFVNRHLMKVQVDFRRLTDRARRSRSDELRAQVQFLF